MIEIERKFLVTSKDFLKQFKVENRIVQGYLSSVPERTVRVRIKGKKGYLTIKGKSNENGLSRMEWEKEIDVKEAESLLQICESGVIDKIRYDIELGNHTFEVDIFEGENKGLIIAEIELQSENESFEKPDWLGKEVTGDERYYNAYLSKKPFVKW
ncbi:CYTH domain-containing protein [uncultured Flavobacterium sp.]|uniref:CYTH domain-containing protein n=1 Tax=uncultured Flavobacterium sp. TaxID=165435 RepID=UPI0030ED0CD0|tara:strand:+ start:93200 stop:93667 length:468 start_codon:yes stop_codon:yes gene_type:complete